MEGTLPTTIKYIPKWWEVQERLVPSDTEAAQELHGITPEATSIPALTTVNTRENLTLAILTPILCAIHIVNPYLYLHTSYTLLLVCTAALYQ